MCFTSYSCVSVTKKTPILAAAFGQILKLDHRKDACVTALGPPVVTGWVLFGVAYLTIGFFLLERTFKPPQISFTMKSDKN